MRRINTVIGALTMAGAMAGAVTLASPAAQAAPTTQGVVTQGWQCSVPPGMTWNWAANDALCSGGLSFNVIAPAEGVEACSVPNGWSYTQIVPSGLCTPDSGLTNAYILTRA
jgi:hypothetical protein